MRNVQTKRAMNRVSNEAWLLVVGLALTFLTAFVGTESFRMSPTVQRPLFTTFSPSFSDGRVRVME